MNLVIHETGSNNIKAFIKDCIKRGSRYSGTNRSLQMHSEGHTFVWTEDEPVPTAFNAIGLPTGWDRQVADIVPVAGGTEIAKQDHKTVLAAVGIRNQIASMTYAQVDNYIDANVTDLASARAFLKILAKVVLAVIKIQDKE